MEEEAIESESPSPSPPPVKIKISIPQAQPGTSVNDVPETEQKSDDEDADHQCHICQKAGTTDDMSSDDESDPKKDSSIPWIRCDICNYWFHLECVNLEEYQSILIDRFHCAQCSIENGPSKLKVKCNDTRYNFDKEDEIDKPVQIGTKHWIANFAAKEMSIPAPSPDIMPIYQNGTEFMNKFKFSSDEWKTPVKILDKEGLGMNLPPADFYIDDLEKIVDVEESIDTIDVYMQQSCKMKLKSFFEKWRENPRERLYNMLSFEFSQSPLMQLIKAPELMYRLSWVHKIWRIEGTHDLDDEYSRVLLPEHENLRPDVAMFCLLGMGGSYTDFHIDFGGSSVWYHVFKGKKIFYILEPKDECLDAFERWTFHAQRTEIFMPMFLGRENGHLLKRVEINEGETVMIPAGWIHAVYTPVDSIVFGGNFIHELNIRMQLKIYELEIRAKYGINFMFPNFELANWYAGRALVERLAAANDEDRTLPEHLITGLHSLHGALMSWKQRDKEQKIEEHEYFYGLIAELGRELRTYRSKTKSQSKSPSPRRKIISRNNSEAQLQNLLTGFGTNDPSSSCSKSMSKMDRKRAKEESKAGKLSKKDAHYVSNMFSSRGDGSGRRLKPASWVTNNNVSIETSQHEESKPSKGFYNQFTKEELETMKKAEKIGERDAMKLGDTPFGCSDDDDYVFPEVKKKKKNPKKEESKGTEAPPVAKTVKKGYATPKQRLAKKLKIR